MTSPRKLFARQECGARRTASEYSAATRLHCRDGVERLSPTAKLVENHAPTVSKQPARRLVDGAVRQKGAVACERLVEVLRLLRRERFIEVGLERHCVILTRAGEPKRAVLPPHSAPHKDSPPTQRTTQRRATRSYAEALRGPRARRRCRRRSRCRRRRRRRCRCRRRRHHNQ